MNILSYKTTVFNNFKTYQKRNQNKPLNKNRTDFKLKSEEQLNNTHLIKNKKYTKDLLLIYWSKSMPSQLMVEADH